MDEGETLTEGSMGGFRQTLLVAPSEYAELHAAVTQRLTPNRLPLLIGIDGRDGASKSSCGSWLAWQLGMPCIHLDLYVANSNFGEWHVDHLRRVIIDGRLARKRPIIVEGCLLIRALAKIGRKPDFLAFVENTANSGSESLSGMIEEYLTEATPQKRADFTIRGHFEGAKGHVDADRLSCDDGKIT
jgi:hypothetical protein